jgi:gliding motility-associated-like protein
MFLATRRFPFFLLSCLTCLAINAQTLYWVGGSGNFNDPKHWSLNAEGVSANLIPNSSSNVIFIESFYPSDINVTIDNRVEINSIKIETNGKLNFIRSSRFARLVIASNFDNFLNNTEFNSNVIFEFKNNFAVETGSIRFGETALNCDVIISSGRWSIDKIKLFGNHRLSIINSAVEFKASTLELGNLDLDNCNYLYFNHAVLKVNHEINVKNCDNYLMKKSVIGDKAYDGPISIGGLISIAGKKGSSNQVNFTCIPTPTIVNTTCVPGCDGKIIITLPNPSCFSPAATLPYNIIVTSQTTCVDPLNSLFGVGPGTYTLSNFCGCIDPYSIQVEDANGILFDPGAVVFNQTYGNPPILASPASGGTVTNINCNGVCSGSLNVTFFNGLAPYNFTITPPGGAPVTATSNGALALTNLCAGVLLISIQDANLCTQTYSRTFLQPPALNTNSVLTNATCNGLCNGSLNISPTGGSPNYTVNFSPGSTFTAAVGSTVSTTGLCAGPVSYTITDSKACVTVRSATVTQPPAITVISTQSSLTCNGVCNGSATLTISGGVSPYTVVVVPPTGPSNTLTSATGNVNLINLCAGIHNVNVLDNNNCLFTYTFDIAQPPPIIVVPTLTNVTCNGGCDGRVEIAASGGSGSYTYFWSPNPPFGQNTATISGVCAGAFVATVNDGTCSVNVTVTVTQPPALTLTPVTQSASCFGVCDGSSTITPSGGNGGPFNFVWSPAPPSGQNTAIISNLCGGSSYIVSVTDASLCPIVSAPISITQPSSITPNITTTSITCNGLCNGGITASPTGTVVFNYTLASATSTITNPPPYVGLCAGDYTLFIQNTASSCIESFTTDVIEPSLIVPSVVTTNLLCFNQCIGTLSGSASGGTPTYTFSWTTPTGPATGPNLTNQCAGNYVLTVRDANNCTVTAAATILEPPDLIGAITSISLTCFTPPCNGILQVTPFGGTIPYTYSWSAGATPTLSAISNLCAGNYTLILTDANSCAKSITAAIASPAAIVLGQTTLPVSCAGGSNGSATVTASGGAGSFTFQFNTVPATVPIANNTTGLITGLSAGNYVADVTDGNGCTQSIPFTIASPPPLLATITGSQASCNACIGAATVTPSSGTPPYLSFVWTNSLAATVSTLATANALCAGDYTVVVTDNNSCTSIATVNIPQSIAITLGLSSASVQCFGGITGSASATPSGGAPIYSFTWSPGGQNTSAITGLSAGAYVVFVRDALGCSAASNVNISEPPLLVVNATKTDVTCFGSCNGLITTTVSGGTPGYIYSWSPVAATTSSLTSVCSGTYTLTVTDNNGCPQTLPTFTVNENPPLVVTFTTTNPSNCSAVGANGSICATVTGGSGSGYTYTWSPVNSGLSCINSLTAGVYVLDATDGALCPVNASTILINPGGPTLTVNSQSITCFGGANGSATATATGGSGTFSFDWSPAVTFSTVVGNVTTASGLTTGTYIVSSTDLVSGCITASNVIIIQPSSVTANATISDVTCNGLATGSVNLVPSGGTPPYAYTWAPPVVSTTNTATGLAAGIYSLTVTDFNTCSTTFTFSVSEPAPLLLTNVATDVKCNAACDGSIVATPSGGTPVYSYTWLPVGAFPGATGTGTASLINLCPNTYVLNLVDANGCVANNIITISEPTALTSTLNLVQPACFTSTDAIASHLASGGTPTYAFSWSSSAATTSTLSILTGGNYTATVTDVNGCATNQTFAVVFPLPLTVTLTSADPKCNASCDGSITATLSGAQGAVAYNWLPLGVFPGANTSSISGLCANASEYTLIATDGNLCQTTATITLIDPPPLFANVSFTNPLCNGDCNGVAISTALNAVGAVNYTWSAVPTNTPSLNNLCFGVITVTVQDQNLCRDVQTFTLVDPPVLNAVAAVIDANCTLADGSITITASGGTPLPDYLYTWSPPVSTTNTANGVFAGVYSATVADGNNCTFSLSIIVNNINGPTAAPVTSSSVTCNGYFDGTAFVNTVTIVGGTPSYTVAWLAPIASSVNPAMNLPAGNYNAQITDDNNCVLITTVSISEPAPVIVAPTFTLPSCNNSPDGIINLNPSGGVSPSFSYTWSTGTTTIATLSSTLANASAGDYTIIISDNGCLSTQTLTLLPQSVIIANIAVTPNICFGDCNGSALITSVSGGVAPYQYSWSDGTTGASMNNLCNGTYSLIVTDNNGCANLFTVSITSNPQITASTSIVSPSCNLCNGASTITALGGTGGAYSYSWTNGSTIDEAFNLCAGLYQVLVTDLGSGCQQLENVIINNSTGIRGENINIQSIPCNNACTGAATVTAVGGTPPISYNWLNPAISNSVITNLCAGTYFLQMVDAQGCIRSTSVVLSPITTLSVSAFASAPGCGGLTNGTITAIISGGTPGYNITWSPSGATTATLAGVGAGIYTITATESSTNACSISQQINLNTSASPTVVGSQTNINCFGACTGVINTAVSGTAIPFSYQWSTGGNAPSLTNLCSGVISLTVTDNNNCVAVQSFNINENTPILTGIPQIIQPICNLCNGSSTINPIGGVLPYTYAWTNGSNGLGTASLCAGIYNVLITDNVGCQQTETIVINNSNGITGETFSVQGLPCNNSCNGSATVTAVGGTAPYTYNWISPAVTGSVNTNLCAGTYFVQMTDNVGCIRTSSVDIIPAITLSLTPIITTPGCGLNNGAINLQVSGGVPAYTFSWQPVANNTATLGSIFQGSYTVTVTESSPNNCSVTQQINVSNANAPSISYTQTNINCFNACAGVIATIASGTATPFTYNWSVGGNAPTITNLCDGLLTLAVTGTDNCVAIQSFTVTQNPLLQIGVPLLTQPTCNQCNGAASINAFGGVLPYSYAWTNGANASSTSSLCAGLYQVLLTDNLGCQQTQNIVINNSNGITGEVTNVQNESCVLSCNGAATVTAVGGTSPISYNWINPPTPGATISNLCAGSYFVQMVDAQGCIRTTSIGINAAVQLSLTPLVKSPSCGASDGSITVVPSGGSGSYTFSWSPSGNTPSLTSLGVGAYSLTLSDAINGCSIGQAFLLSNANGPVISYTQANIDCFGTCTGSISAVATGTAPPYNFNWSTGSTIPDVTNLCQGIVILTVTSTADNCATVQSYTISENPELQLSLSNTVKPRCFDGCDGVVTLIPSGGSLPYTYSWSATGTTNPKAGLCAGIQSVVVTDARGCQNSVTVTLNNPAPISVTATANNSSCNSVNDGSIDILVDGGTPTYTFAWQGPSGYSASTQSIANVFAGNYSLTLTDFGGCRRDTVLSLVTTVTINALAGRDTSFCFGIDVTLDGSQSIGAVKYDWYRLPNTIVPIAMTPSFVVSGITNSSTYILLTTSSVSGCVDRDTVMINIFPDTYLDAGPDLTIPIYASVTIGGNPTTFGVASLSWAPSQYLNDPTLPNPVASNTVNTTFTVTVVDLNGCVLFDTMRVELYPEITITNGFSPNADGRNDTWIIDYIDQFPDCTVEIYNRWGEQLFYSKGYNVPFDGRYKGKELPVGTYYYIINLNYPTYPKPYTGPLTIFR